MNTPDALHRDAQRRAIRARTERALAAGVSRRAAIRYARWSSPAVSSSPTRSPAPSAD